MTDNSSSDEDPALQKYSLIAPCVEDGVTLTERAKQIGVNRKTLARLIDKFDRGGMEALRRKERSDKGSSTVSEDTLKFVKGKLLTSPILSLATIERQLQRLNSHEEDFSASYQQIRRIKNGIHEDLLIFARSEKEFEEERELLFRHEAGHPNEVWQCDHKYLDIFVWNTSEPAARSVKPVLTAIIDDYSRAIMGYYLDLSPPSAQRTAITLRQAIWKKDSEDWLVCGIPERLYTDRGADFKSARIEQIAAELGIRLSKTKPRKPRGKGKIERFFETVNQTLMSELPGYTPEDAQQAEPGMTLKQLQIIFQDWLLSEYMQHVHSETGETPFSRWTNHHQVPRLAPSLEALNILLLTVPGGRKIRQDGVRILSNVYFAPEFEGLVGKDVTVRYDPSDVSEILVYLNNKLLCRAKCSELTGQKPTLREHLIARALYKRKLRNEIRESINYSTSMIAALRKLPEPAAQAEITKRSPGIKRYSVEE